MLPAPSISAEGSWEDRSSPDSRADCTETAIFEGDQLAPPSVDDVQRIAFPGSFRNGTTTCPFARTSGWPPSPLARSGVLTAAPHVFPPSTDVFIRTTSRWAASSHST